MSKTKNESHRRAIVLTADQFEDMKVYFPVFRLQEEGWDGTIAAPAMQTLYGAPATVHDGRWTYPHL